MPFDATLFDVGTSLPAITLTGDVFTIQDLSNYTTASEAGHAEANFTNFFKLIITSPSNSIFTFSALGDGDQTIAVPSTGTHSFNFTRTELDGIYSFQLLTVPTWNTSDQYELDDYLWNTSETTPKLYRSKTTNTNKQPDTNPSDWELRTEAQLSSKYTDTQSVGDDCEGDTCMKEKLSLVVCDILDANCIDLCNNRHSNDFFKSWVLLETINLDIASGKFADAKIKFNALNAICNC